MSTRRTFDGALLGVAEASRLLGNSERSLRALVANGVIPYKKLGGRVVFRRVELERWIETLEGVSPKDAEANRTIRSKQ